MNSTGVMMRVSSLLSFAKETVVKNIIEARNRGDLSLDDENLRKISNLVDLSVSQSMSLGAQDVETAISDLVKSSEKTKTKKK